MRRVTTCAPIRSDEAYSTEWREGVHEALVGRTNTSVRYYEFGNGTKGCEGTNKTTDLTTFCVTQYQKDNFQVPYTVRGATAYHNNNSASDFEPIAAFRVPDADTTLLSIMSTAKYTGNVTDPLFNALNRSVVSQQVFFESTHDLNVLGCTEQYQFCNLGNGRCTALTGLYGIQQAFEIGDLSLNAKQSAMFQVMWKATWAMGLQWASKLLSDNLLLAKDWAFTAIAQTSSALPPDQWQSEAYNIHNLSLAVFQRRINEYAKPESFEIRPGVNSLNQLVEPTDPEMRALCGLQKIRSSDHYSVSILGMSIILVVGGVLILLDWILVQQIFWFRSVTHARQAKKADWTNTGTLQLYRQALESRGVGPWKVKDFEFPVLLSRNYTFMGLGSQHDPATQLHRMDSGDWAQQHTAYMPEHAVPQYTALTPQTPDMEGEIQVLGESKSSDGKLR
ncbi:hypothetical protein BU24DRAFT_356210 [Aaosphaeria arxii CBS 175.79]|uniref:Uncharacterized protein n=1 Tax=Aaosphaeria arxii CBS 175.79 TaxID=1450172 RepID=A0A6A5XBK8_9PLEO|nr:uncharacterized protein BU24DRAFT_356210 [Aaosphaeria arxii CBS 175.79]KAF2010293.1 hypothetical protein BU24DRAFT_356210 [Aaosphaeria arxii CBS 175.79]